MNENTIDETLERAIARLLAERNAEGYWPGRLSSSALATAVAAGALAIAGGDEHRPLVRRGLDWLAENANDDGGWGDTPDSPSNISTTLLAFSAFALAGADGDFPKTVVNARRYVARLAGGLNPEAIVRAVNEKYRNDRTFSAPILAFCCIAGRLGPAREAWRHVAGLPFELATLPHRLLQWMRLPVVSYALPALIAVGVARYYHRRPANPIARLVRRVAWKRALLKLREIQPAGGGFLEAAPLTGFVACCLASIGLKDHPVTRACAGFLSASVRGDGSWPIDTNLATWVTGLSVRAVSGELSERDETRLRDWLLDAQYRDVHPYTRAKPGGWAWTPLPGAVPDADDTAGALLAIRALTSIDDRARRSAAAGAAWLCDIQNRDGGIPTFCRGWGKLPFDRSSPDLTAHAILAWRRWRNDLPARLARRVDRCISGAMRFLTSSRQADGSWAPLWFGCQYSPGKQNLTYGTAKVVSALLEIADDPSARSLAAGGIGWLVRAQNDDGGWGGAAGVASCIEETALATDALAKAAAGGYGGSAGDLIAAVRNGAGWLIERTGRARRFDPSPIGLYFAELWYAEKLYPLIFTISALRRARNVLFGPSPRRVDL